MSKVTAIRKEPTSMVFPLDQIGGGKVVRPFRRGYEMVMAGTTLTQAEIAAMTPANRQSLLGRFIAVWPKAPGDGFASRSSGSAAKAERPQRHVVALGFGQFHVIEGVLLTDKPVDEKTANKIAGKDEAKPKTKAKRKPAAAQ